MGTLYRNGIPYVGSGGAGGVEVTQAEYDALPTSEKMNGSIYFITDGSVSYPTASQMRYDNTESGIPSTSVQGAIDELKIEIGDTDISSIGDGTLSGAVSELNNSLNGLHLISAVVNGTTTSYGTITIPNPAGRSTIFLLRNTYLDDVSGSFGVLNVDSTTDTTITLRCRTLKDGNVNAGAPVITTLIFAYL